MVMKLSEFGVVEERGSSSFKQPDRMIVSEDGVALQLQVVDVTVRIVQKGRAR